MQGITSSGIHSTAIVAPGARLGQNVTIGPYSILHPDVELGDGSFVGAHCELGVPVGGALPIREPGKLVFGPSALIRSGSVFYSGSSFGPRFECGHKVTIREQTSAGENFRVGTLSDLQGHCAFGDYVRIHGNVQVGQGSEVGSYVWIFPFTVLTNDPHPPSVHLVGVKIRDYAVIGASTTVLPGVLIGSHAVVAAMSLVKDNVPDGMLAAGHPSKVICPAKVLRDRFDPRQKPYPWPHNFDRGLPWEGEDFEHWLSKTATNDPSDASQTRTDSGRQ